MARSRRTAPALPSQAPVWGPAALVAASGLLAYANALRGPFVLDDQLSVVGNQTLRAWPISSTVLFPERDSPLAGRPLVNLSFAVNYALGGLNVFGYHVVNVALHVACALLLYGLVRRTLDLAGFRGAFERTASLIACAVALIWVVHPLNSEAVDYLTQRTESMMACCYLLALYASVRAVESTHARAWRSISVLACALGMASKESMVTAPVLILLYDRVFVSGGFRDAVRSRWPFYAGLFSTWIVLLALEAGGPRGASAGLASDVSPWTYLLNQTVMIVRYLRLAVSPRQLVVYYGWPVPLTLADVMPRASAVAALFVVALVALWRRPRLGFLGAWFFLTLAPTSSIVPVASEVGAERRMYLPLMALVTMAVVGSPLAWRRITRHDGVAGGAGSVAVAPGWIAVAIVAALLIAATIDRNREYASQLSLVRTAVERWPSSITHHILGAELMAAGDHNGAVRELRAALPGDPRAHTELGVELFNQGRFEEAIGEFRALIAIRESPPALHPHWQPPLAVEIVAARVFIGRSLARQKRWQQAIEEDRRTLAMDPQSVEAHGLLAEALFAERSYDEAIPHYQQYLSKRPDEPGALQNFGIALAAGGRLDEAIAAFRRAVDLNPADANARRNLETALQDRRGTPQTERLR